MKLTGGAIVYGAMVSNYQLGNANGTYDAKYDASVLSNIEWCRIPDCQSGARQLARLVRDMEIERAKDSQWPVIRSPRAILILRTVTEVRRQSPIQKGCSLFDFFQGLWQLKRSAKTLTLGVFRTRFHLS